MNNEVKWMLKVLPDYITDYYEYMEGINFELRNCYARIAGELYRYLSNHTQLNLNNPFFYKFIQIEFISDFLGSLSSDESKEEYFFAIKNFYYFLELHYLILQDELPDLDLLKRNQMLESKNNRTLETIEIHLIRKKLTNTVKNKRYYKRPDLAARDLLMFDLFVITGISVNELIRLNIDDVDVAEKTVTINSGKKDKRLVSIKDEILQDYKKWMTVRHKEKITDALLINSVGKRMSNKTVENTINSITGLIGRQGITVADLRTTATNI